VVRIGAPRGDAIFLRCMPALITPLFADWTATGSLPKWSDMPIIRCAANIRGGDDWPAGLRAPDAAIEPEAGLRRDVL
jgi:hypothetical protein